MRIVKIKTFFLCSIIFQFDKIRDDDNWRKRQLNTVDFFFFNLYEHKVLNTYRMLLRLCIELRCIV